jgi:spore germination protein KA
MNDAMAGKRRYFKGPMSVDDMNDKKRTRRDSGIRKKAENLEKQYKASLDKSKVSDKLDDNINMLKRTFKNCSDFIPRELVFGGNGVRCLVACIDNLVNMETLNNCLLKPLMTDAPQDDSKEAPADLIRRMKDSLVYFDNIEETGSLSVVVEGIMKGSSVLLIDGCNKALALSMAEWKGRQVTDATIERVVRGPHEAFVENIDTNLSLLRNRLRTPDLKTEKLEIGRLSATSVIITYISGVVDEKIVDEVKSRIVKVDIDIIPDSSYIDRFIADEALSPFPQAITTERPDKVMTYLAEGRVAIFADGSPNVLIVPVTLPDFLASVEDHYDLFYFSTFFRIMRYFAFALTLFGPSIYIAITTFHQEMIPLPLLITIARSRAEIPFPAIVEALLMEFTFELLREAGIRLPNPVGPAVSIVGGLVIGQGVVQAGIVSQTMVIVVAITGTASFSIPAFNFTIAVRVIRFPMMLLAAFLGIYGIIMGLLVLLIHLVSLRSIGVPYLSPIAPLSIKDMKDTIVRAPLWSIVSRPTYIHNKNQERIKRGLKPKPDSGG